MRTNKAGTDNGLRARPSGRNPDKRTLWRTTALTGLIANGALSFGISDAAAQTFDRYIVIQPIQVCDDAGNNCSVVNYWHAGTAKALGQANVLPIFLPTTQFNSTALQASNDGPSDFNDGNGGSGAANTINMWFTDPGSIVDCGGPGTSIVGCANTPGKRIVIDAVRAAGDNPYSNVIAHEIGHNFDLPHLAGSTPSNLMDPFVDDSYYDQMGVTESVLNQGQINTIRGDGKLQSAVNFNGDGNANVVIVATGTAYQNIFGNGGNDIILLNAGSGVLADIQGGAGGDNITLNALSVVGGNVSGGADADILTIGGLVLQNVLGDEGDDTIRVLSTGQVVRGVDGGSGDDTIVIDGMVAADPLPAVPPTIATVPSPSHVRGGIGNDSISINAGGVVTGNVFGDDGDGNEGNGDGNDTITMTGGRVAGDILGEGGDDTIVIAGGIVQQFQMLPGGGGAAQGGNVLGGGGADTMTLSGGTIAGNMDGGADNDTMLVSGGSVANVLGGSGEDTITLNGGIVVVGIDGGDDDDGISLNGGSVSLVNGGNGNDTITLAGATVLNAISGDAGNDIISLTSGSVGSVLAGTGADRITLNGAAVTVFIDGGGDDDIIDLLAGTAGSARGGTGNDTITLAGATIFGSILGQDGDDAININSGSAFSVHGGIGVDTITMNGGTITTSLEGEQGADIIRVHGGSVGTNVSGGDGDDDIALFGGAVGGSLTGDAGADIIRIHGGSVGANVSGGDGGDDIALFGGAIGGNVMGDAGADVILLQGAVINGNIDAGADDDDITIRSGQVGNVLAGSGDDTGLWTGGTVLASIDMGLGSDTLDIVGVNAGGNALQAGLVLLDGGDDASSADGQVDRLNLRGVAEVLTDLQNWEFINLLDSSDADMGAVTRTIITEEFFIENGSMLTASSPAGGQIYTIDGDLINDGALQMQAAGAYDEFGVTGTYAGGVGSGIGMDTFVGAAGSPSDLVRVGAATQGETGLLINDTNAAGPGVFNPTGTELVRVESAAGGSTAPEHFYLINGPIEKDLWIFDLGLDDTRSLAGRANADVHVLYSRPTAELQFTPNFATGALTAYHTSLDPWIDRQTALAERMARAWPEEMGDGLGERATAISMWASPFGSRRAEDAISTLTFFNNVFTTDTSYSQTTYGIQGGVDFMSDLGENRAFMAGVFGGSLYSRVSADAIAISGTYSGGSLGAYASYLHGGLMMSGVLKADFLNFDWRAPGLGLEAETDLNTVGGRIEATYKHKFNESGWLQPYANLTYARSSWDQFDVLATTFDLGGNDSLLGRVGLRIGADIRDGGSTFNVFAGAGVAYEFSGDNQADIISGGVTLPLVHSIDTTTFEVQAGAKWIAENGFSLSLSGQGNFSKNVEHYGGRATLSFQF